MNNCYAVKSDGKAKEVSVCRTRRSVESIVGEESAEATTRRKKEGGVVAHDNRRKKYSTDFFSLGAGARGISRCDVPPSMDSFSVRPHGRTLVIHNAIGQFARRNNHELPKKA